MVLLGHVTIYTDNCMNKLVLEALKRDSVYFWMGLNRAQHVVYHSCDQQRLSFARRRQVHVTSGECLIKWLNKTEKVKTFKEQDMAVV
jgi:hypothetical protein